jgi:hypothetical protein
MGMRFVFCPFQMDSPDPAKLDPYEAMRGDSFPMRLFWHQLAVLIADYFDPSTVRISVSNEPARGADQARWKEVEAEVVRTIRMVTRDIEIIRSPGGYCQPGMYSKLGHPVDVDGAQSLDVHEYGPWWIMEQGQWSRPAEPWFTWPMTTEEIVGAYLVKMNGGDGTPSILTPSAVTPEAWDTPMAGSTTREQAEFQVKWCAWSNDVPDLAFDRASLVANLKPAIDYALAHGFVTDDGNPKVSVTEFNGGAFHARSLGPEYDKIAHALERDKIEAYKAARVSDAHLWMDKMIVINQEPGRRKLDVRRLAAIMD